uniref:Uncharacterized protein n=1 Tax=Ascaris lumbricoides TaxID=6252 RepID=A0A0M3ISQ3_ASCLU
MTSQRMNATSNYSQKPEKYQCKSINHTVIILCIDLMLVWFFEEVSTANDSERVSAINVLTG